ncbi:hypothetical protein AAFC00_001633 [Neodothiora populina]|uniref:Uncharacterized protein n=1 Tax=Neodothiora populina TaxID=2781224 RepID=A0ABR3PPM0_9PEZI
MAPVNRGSIARLSTVIPAVVLSLISTAASASVPKATGNEKTYDYIIVGGGVAGLVAANRLSEDSTKSVLVVEYGYIDNTTTTLWPYKAQGIAVNAGDVFTGTTSVEQPGLGNQTFELYVASVVGGGSIVNGMAFDRGTQPDYNSWATLGNSGWAWSNLLTYFKKSTTFTPPSADIQKKYNYTWDTSAYGNGPVHSSYPPFQFPEMPTFWDALNELEITKLQEGGLGEPGAFWEVDSIDPVLQTRSSARTAYYDPIAKRANLELRTGSYVQKLVIINNNVEGVEVISRKDNSVIKAYARNEVILAAGAVHTPQILQLNGIGPASVLKAANISVSVDLPGVGANFQDHPVAYMSYDMTTDKSYPYPGILTYNATYNASALAEYVENKTGPYTQAHGNGAVFLPLSKIAPSSYKSIASTLSAQNPTDYLPSIYAERAELLAGFKAQRAIHLQQIQADDTSIYEFSFNGGGTATTALQKPISRGTIMIDPKNPTAEPIIDFQALANPVDRAALLAAVRFTRQIYNTTALSGYTPVETLPGPEYQTDEELWDALSTSGVVNPSFAHPCGTAAMMPRKQGGVVASDLLVYGVKRLSVIDASIIPIIPATHLQATVYAIAEKAADLIKARA